MKETINIIKENKIIAIIRGVGLKDIIPTAKALQKGGIKLVEITFNQLSPAGEEDTCTAIQHLSELLGSELCIGAGTVMNSRQAELAIRAGAKYIISPNTSLSVIKKTNEMGAISIPGALTPTEVTNAYEAGAHFVKLFPAGSLGLSYIKAVRAPLNHIPVLAVGGVNDKNLMDFFDAGVCGVGIGSNIVNKELIKKGEFNELTRLARKFTTQL